MKRILKFLSLFRPHRLFKIFRHLYIISLTEDKTDVILKIIYKYGFNSFLEIGVHYGLNLVSLAKKNPQVRFIGIDPFSYESSIVKGVAPSQSNFQDTVYSNLMRRSSKLNNIEIIKDYSFNVVSEFEDESLDFVFIDGAHEFKSVTKDISDWLPKVKKGGVLGGHDYSLKYFGVVQAVNEILGYDNVTITSDDVWLYFK